MVLRGFEDLGSWGQTVQLQFISFRGKASLCFYYIRPAHRFEGCISRFNGDFQGCNSIFNVEKRDYKIFKVDIQDSNVKIKILKFSRLNFKISRSNFNVEFQDSMLQKSDSLIFKVEIQDSRLNFKI